MDDMTAAMEKARELFQAAAQNNLLLLAPGGHSTCKYNELPVGSPVISVGFFGPMGFVAHVQDYGIKR